MSDCTIHLRRCAPTATVGDSNQVVSGRGTVAAFTINHQPFMPGFDPPYAFAFIEIDEDPTIRLGTNIVGCELDAIRVGMTVEVTFEESGDYFVPLFKPTAST